MKKKWQAKCVRENVKQKIDHLQKANGNSFQQQQYREKKKIEKKTNAKTITQI